jgi:hypothetical protein
LQHVIAILGTIVVFCLLQAMLYPQLMYEHKSVTLEFSRDLAVGLTLMIVLARLGWRRGIGLVFALAWLAIVVFEYARSIGAVAMGQDPLLYDAILLVSHMVVLFRDMMGETYDELFWKVGGGMALSAAFTWAGLAWVAYRHRQGSWIGASIAVVLVWGLVWGTTLEASPYPSKFSMPALVDNSKSSFTVWWQLREGVSGEAYAPLDDLQLREPPDIHIYLVESYGNIMNRKAIREAWRERLTEMEQNFAKNGWQSVTGTSEAPVSGGRSWLADATLLSGIRVEYESVYRHLMAEVAEMPNMVGFLRKQGYRSLLVRPKDRARPGVELVNHFDFDATVFFEDLTYTGRSYGWSGIPDQFTLGRIEEEFIPALGEGPRFVFFHMATSHLPWNELPPIVDDWRTLNQREMDGETKPKQKGRKKEIKFQLKRYKRKNFNRTNRLRAKTQNLEKYATAIHYDLEILTQYVMDLPVDRPAVVILMGDHQPPMIGRSRDFKVPMHVLSQNPALLQEFKDRGFAPGMLLKSNSRTLRHEGFFSVLARALARGEGLKPPKFMPHGAVKLESVSAPVAQKEDEDDEDDDMEPFPHGMPPTFGGFE